MRPLWGFTQPRHGDVKRAGLEWRDFIPISDWKVWHGTPPSLALSLVPPCARAVSYGRFFDCTCRSPGVFAKADTMTPNDDTLRGILTQTKVIALVGWSIKPMRPSHEVAAYLARRGYRVIPVNPGHAGLVTAWGETVRASMADIDEPVDMVDIFRNPDAVEPVVDEALAVLPGLKTIWMQLGVINEAAAAKATAAGLQVVMDRCPAIEIPRLFG